jgi:DNA polymerase I-like protein with 3'-5' exonuclease and polymerase domains
MRIHTLDIETAPTKKTDLPYALEPYRVQSNQSKITSVAVWYPDGTSVQLKNNHLRFREELIELMHSLHGEEVYAHNAIFDLAYLIAYTGMDVLRPITWRDTAVLNKYLINGEVAEERMLSYSLKACVKRVIKYHPNLEEFLEMKSQNVAAGEDEEYWDKRGLWDVEFTYLLATKLLTHMTPEMQPGYDATSKALLPLAQGWLEGIVIDRAELQQYKQATLEKQVKLLSELGINGATLTSTKQLGILLFDTYGLEPIGFTPKGQPSTSAENMLRLHQKYPDNPNLDKIMEYRRLATMMSKYVKGFEESMAYIGTNKIHGSPRVLSTITGRMTYSSKLLKKFQVSIAMHQLPRKEKGIKRCMKAPRGYKVLYMDVSAQEGRIMAIQAPEPTMINAYRNGIDLHSDLTEEIFGTPYSVIVEANKAGEPKEIIEQRQAGKLTGLSSFYRIGAKALAAKFFATYEYDISISTAHSYLTSFKRKYPGVVEYWRKAITMAQRKGYAEAFGGWRYRIKTFDWKGESSAINHPIQGSGAMQTYATIGVISERWPELILVSQVHDSLAYFIPEDGAFEKAKELKDFMNSFDYGKLLNFEQTVPIVLDVAIGDNFADLTTVR